MDGYASSATRQESAIRHRRRVMCVLLGKRQFGTHLRPGLVETLTGET